MEEKVLIILSTFNAQTYLREQLDSLLALEYEEYSILIRDDGSKDDTCSILEEYSDTYNEISYYKGENIGAIESFFDLMRHVQTESFTYLAFCDQDDVWKKEKLARATAILKKAQEHGGMNTNGSLKCSKVIERERLPILYCGKPKLVDAELHPLGKEIKRTMRPGFGNALIENIVTGCTTVINRELYEILLEYMPDYCIMHDWWFYVIATCFGQVIYDETELIYYRQHGSNVMGIDGKRTTELKNRTQKFNSRKSNICIQAEQLVTLMKENEAEWLRDAFINQNSVVGEEKESKKITNYQKRVKQCYKRAKQLANYKENMQTRFRMFLSRYFYRQRLGDHIIFKLLFLLGLR